MSGGGVYSGSGWKTVISASKISDTFGIPTSDIAAKVVGVAYNTDFNANTCVVSCAVGDYGLQVCAATSGMYRVDVRAFMP